jgi:hypothetical protein
MATSNFKKYIGDSVYADFDGMRIILTTENGLPTDPSNRIVLEPEVFNDLNAYWQWVLQELYKEKINEPDGTEAS